MWGVHKISNGRSLFFVSANHSQDLKPCSHTNSRNNHCIVIDAQPKETKARFSFSCSSVLSFSWVPSRLVRIRMNRCEITHLPRHNHLSGCSVFGAHANQKTCLGEKPEFITETDSYVLFFRPVSWDYGQIIGRKEWFVSLWWGCKQVGEAYSRGRALGCGETKIRNEHKSNQLQFSSRKKIRFYVN